MGRMMIVVLEDELLVEEGNVQRPIIIIVITTICKLSTFLLLAISTAVAHMAREPRPPIPLLSWVQDS